MSAEAAMRLASDGSQRLLMRRFIRVSSRFARQMARASLRHAFSDGKNVPQSAACDGSSLMSSRCADNSAITSSFVSGGNLSFVMRARTSLFQSGMAASGQAVEGLEKRAPFLAQWGKLAAAGGREAIVAAVASSFVRLPVGFYPSTLFHFVEQRVERGEGELESAVGALANLLGNFESVERLLRE